MYETNLARVKITKANWLILGPQSKAALSYAIDAEEAGLTRGRDRAAEVPPSLASKSCKPRS